jgi:hypothetical protein
MTPREIIASAWSITTREKLIRRWSFASSFCETLLSLKFLSYQFYFLYRYFSDGTGAGFFDIEILLFDRIPFWVFATIIGTLATAVFIEFFVPHLCLGAIIGLGARAYRREDMKGGFVLGLYNFFPIFAIHEFLFLSSITTMLTATSLVLRYVDGDVKFWSIIGIAVLWTVTNILRFFFSFAEEGVVIEKLGIFASIGKSLKLIISHLGRVMFLILLLVVISLRIGLNLVMVILLPAMVIGLGLLLTLILSPAMSYSIAGVLGVALIVVASYFLAYLHAFKQNVWTITYLELMKEKELDVIL